MNHTFNTPVLLHAAVMCPNMDASIAFYSETFGLNKMYEWPKTVSDEGHIIYEGRGVYLELSEDSYIELFPTPSPIKESGPIAHLAIRVKNVYSSYKLALAHGGNPCSVGPWDGSPTGLTISGNPSVKIDVAFVHGPAGEQIEIYAQKDPIVTSLVQKGVVS